MDKGIYFGGVSNKIIGVVLSLNNGNALKVIQVNVSISEYSVQQIEAFCGDIDKIIDSEKTDYAIFPVSVGTRKDRHHCVATFEIWETGREERKA